MPGYIFFAKTAITLAAAGLFLLIRPDVAMWAHEQYRSNILGSYRQYVSTPQLIDNYLQTAKVKKLQIGSGHELKAGWLNTDIDMGSEEAAHQAYLDGSKPFPFPDRAFRYVYSEHVFEHVPYQAGQSMLKESFRVLQPGGRIRLATPNLNQFLALFQENKTPEMKQYMLDKLRWHKWPTTPDGECYILNLVLREWGHQFVYTPKMLKAEMEKAGFRDVKEQTVSQSEDPELRGLEGRAEWEFAAANRYETMVFEGVKP